MKILEKYEQKHEQIRSQAQEEVFNLVGELLSISFEKYDVEVVIESDEFVADHTNTYENNHFMKTDIDFEDISETKNKLEIILSGEIKNNHSYKEAFMLLFSLNYDTEINPPWNPGYNWGNGVNTMNLKIGRKVEQLSDPVFRVDWIHEDFNGKSFDLGKGKGILTFSRNKICKAN